jgi:hypothetical protein
MAFVMQRHSDPFGIEEEWGPMHAQLKPHREVVMGYPEKGKGGFRDPGEVEARREGDVRGTGLMTHYRPTGGFGLERGAKEAMAFKASEAEKGRESAERIAHIQAEKGTPGREELFRAQARLLETTTKEKEEATARGKIKEEFDTAYSALTGKKAPSATDPYDPKYHSALEHAYQAGSHEAGIGHYKESQAFEEHAPLFTAANLKILQATHPDIKIPTSNEIEVLKQSPEVWRNTVLTYGPHLKEAVTPKPRTPTPEEYLGAFGAMGGVGSPFVP